MKYFTKNIEFLQGSFLTLNIAFYSGISYNDNILTWKEIIMIERTLVILKPDAVKRKLCGKIISIFEEAGFDIIAT